MANTLRKAIMTRSSLKKIYLKSRNEKNWVNCKRQWNSCCNLLRKTKQKYFCNLNLKDLNGNEKNEKIKLFSRTKAYRLITSYLKTKIDQSLIVRLLLIHLTTTLLILRTP